MHQFKRAGRAVLALLTIPTVTAVSMALVSGTAHAASTPPVIFNAVNILPGDTLHGQIALPSGSTALDPYVEALNLADGCATPGACSPAGPDLSRTLQLTLQAPDGQAVTETPASLTTPTRLPGGQLPADSGSHSYAVSLTLPASATDSSADRTVSFELRYGGMNASGKIVTKVLGETFSKTPPGEKSSSVLGRTFSKSALPFTGTPAAQLTWTGSVLLVGGVVLLLGVRRRRRD